MMTTKIRSDAKREVLFSENGIPTIRRMSILPPWASVAFAARCARRVQPFIQRYWPDIPEVHLQSIEECLRTSETSALPDADSVNKLISRLTEAYNETNKLRDRGLPDNAERCSWAIGAVLVTAYAVKSAIAGNRWYAADNASDAAQHACGAVDPNYQIVSDLRADFDALASEAEKVGWTDERLDPLSFFAAKMPLAFVDYNDLRSVIVRQRAHKRIVTLTGAGSSVAACLPTVVELGKHLVSDETFRSKLNYYANEILTKEQLNDFEYCHRVLLGNVNSPSWQTSDVEKLLLGIQRQLPSTGIMKFPTPPSDFCRFDETSAESLRDLAMRLHALGALEPGFWPEFFDSSYPGRGLSRPFQGQRKDFLKDIDRFFKKAANPVLELFRATTGNLSGWHWAQDAFDFRNNFEFERRLIEHLNFNPELNDVLGLAPRTYATDVWLNPATSAIVAHAVIYRIVDLLRLDCQVLQERVSTMAPYYRRWLKTVRDAAPNAPARLYTTNWDYVPELVAGFLGWRVNDGFSAIAKFFSDPIDSRFDPHLSVADPDFFRVPEFDSDVEIIKLHGSLDWYTNGVWIFRTKPVKRLMILGELLASGPVSTIFNIEQIGRDGTSRKLSTQEILSDIEALSRMIYSPTPYASDLVASTALIHPTDAKGYPSFEPMRTYAQLLSADLLNADLFWIIGHSLADFYFTNIIEDALSKNPNLKVVIQDPYPSDRGKELASLHARVKVVPLPFGECDHIRNMLDA